MAQVKKINYSLSSPDSFPKCAPRGSNPQKTVGVKHSSIFGNVWLCSRDQCAGKSSVKAGTIAGLVYTPKLYTDLMMVIRW